MSNPFKEFTDRHKFTRPFRINRAPFAWNFFDWFDADTEDHGVWWRYVQEMICELNRHTFESEHLELPGDSLNFNQLNPSGQRCKFMKQINSL